MIEEKLDLILNALLGIKQEQQEFKKELQEFKQELQGFKQELQGFEKNQQGFKQELVEMKAEISLIKSQLDENTQFTKAVLNWQEESDAKFDGHLVEFTKTREDICSINGNVVQLVDDQNSISTVLGEHEVSIRTLRKRSI